MTTAGRDIFISYSSGDEAVARELRGYLDAAGYSCWMAPDDVAGPDPWAKQIIRAIETSRSMVVLISAKSNASEHVGREVELATSRHRPVLPVRIEDVQYDATLEYFLAGTQRVDAHAGALATHRDRILRQLAAIVPKPAAADAPPPPESAPLDPLPTPVPVPPGPAADGGADARREPLPRPARLGVWARANSMLVGSAVTIAALVIVATGVLAFGQPASTEPPGSTSAGSGGPTTPVASPSSQPTPSPTPSAPPTTPPSQSASITIPDGRHEVGVDIEAGTYRLRAPATFCSFQRLRSFGGTSEDFIIDAIVPGYAVVTIKPTDLGFSSVDCGGWSSDLSAVTASKRAIDGDGIYIVGTDILPGTWRSTGGKDCYWARLRGFTGVNEELLANDIVNVATTVTILPGDVGFETNRCGSWRLK
jgi:hypothetical protein